MAYRSHAQIAGSRATRESLCIAWGPTLWVRGTLSLCPPIISDVQPRNARELPHGLQHFTRLEGGQRRRLFEPEEHEDKTSNGTAPIAHDGAPVSAHAEKGGHPGTPGRQHCRRKRTSTSSYTQIADRLATLRTSARPQKPNPDGRFSRRRPEYQFITPKSCPRKLPQEGARRAHCTPQREVLDANRTSPARRGLTAEGARRASATVS